MSIEPQSTDIRTGAPQPQQQSSAPIAPPSAAERADLEEDGRTQRELEDAELGGEG